MRAQVLTAFGGTDQFDLLEIDPPAITAAQVLVRVQAIGINHLETRIRSGSLRAFFPTKLPAVLGKEIAGTVQQIGKDVHTLSVGDRVAGFVDSGSYAEFAVARPEALTLLPECLPFETAAALPVAIETATRMISLLSLCPGCTAVVNGATGAVGTAAVQLLVGFGIHVVGIASVANQEYLVSLGAQPFVYGADLVQRIKRSVTQKIDAALDVAGHGFAACGIELTGSPEQVVSIADFQAGSLGIHISTGSQKPIAKAIGAVLPLVAVGRFHVEVQQSFCLAQLSSAHDVVESGHVRGKIVVVP